MAEEEPSRGAGRTEAMAEGDRIPRATRRRALQAAGALVAGGVGLSVAAPAAAAGRATRASANPAVITMHIDTGTIGPAFWDLILQAMDPLLRANPGLEVRLFPPVWQGTAQASMLAGNGPDIFGDYILTGYTAADLALDLTPYVKSDNVNLSQFMQGQLQYIRQAGLQSPGNPNGLYALPQLTNPTAYAVNLGIVDQLGLKRPQADWTYHEWSSLWQSATIKPNGKQPGRFGGMIDWRGYDHTYNMVSPWVLWGFGGEYVDPKDSARSYLDQPGSIAAGEWAYNLIWEGVGVNNANFAQQAVVCYLQDSDALPSAATGYRGLDWDFFSLPIWPVRPSTYTSANMDGIWAGCQNPDAAWIVLKWVTTTTAWQRLQMRTLMYAPSRLDMYEEWTQVVRQVAPPLRSKNLEVYVQEAQANQEYVGDLFLYASNEAKNVIGNLSQELAARKTTVAAGFTAAARQINALEAAGKAGALRQAAFDRRFKRYTALASAQSGAVNLPAPSRNGIGVAPVPDPSQVRVHGGTWTVTGGGAGIQGSTVAGTLAAASSTAASATYVCRVHGLSAVKPSSSMNGGGLFGLMARSDLSDDAAYVAVAVVPGSGVSVFGQPFAGTPAIAQSPGATPGLLAAGSILLNDAAPASNYLAKPVWLKLVRTVSRWSAFTSLDGRTWLPAGTAVGAEMLGAWVGLFTSAGGSGDLAQATFDSVHGFRPDTFIRVGSA